MKGKLAVLGAVLGAGLFAYNCGGGGTSSGTVSLYLTDEPLDGAKKVEVGIKEIRLEHTGTGTGCTVFSPDQTYRVDLTDLATTLRLLDVTNCPAQPYNRLVVVMEKFPVNVIDQTGQEYQCSLISYNEEGDPRKPNRTYCPDTGNECYLYVSGAVNVIANANTDVALDFSLKESEIDLRQDPCTVAFKVYPLHAMGMWEHMEREGDEFEIEGYITRLDESTFELSVNGMTFTVDYSLATDVSVDALQLASDRHLKVEVECSSFDINTATCVAKEIEVKARGTVTSSGCGPGMTVELETTGETITLDPIECEGSITNGSMVEAEIVSCSGTTCIAHEVELVF